MNKTILTTIATTTTLMAGVASVNAEEVKPLVQENQNVEPSKSATQPTLEQAEKELITAQEELDEIKKEEQPKLDKEVETKEQVEVKEQEVTDLTNLIKENKETTTELKTETQKQEQSSETLKEEIENKKTEIESAKNEVKTATEVLTTAQDKVDSETEKIEPQVTALNEATEQIEQARKELEQAEKDLTEAQDEEVLKQASNEVETNKEAVKIVLQNIEDKINALEVAKEFDKNLTKNIQKTKNQISELEKQKELEEKTLEQNQSLLDNLLKDVADLKEKAERPSMYIDQDFMNVLKTKPETGEELVRLGNIAYNQGTIAQVRQELLKDTRQADPNNYTDEQLKELNIFTAELVRDIRRALGTHQDDLLQVSEETIKLGKEFSKIVEPALKEMAGKEPTMLDVYNIGHNVDLPDAEMRLLGYKSGMTNSENKQANIQFQSEVLGFTPVSSNLIKNWTMGKQKELIYNFLARMMYQDKDSFWGHAFILGNLYDEQADTYLTLDLTTGENYHRFGIQETVISKTGRNNVTLIDSNTQISEDLTITPVTLNDKSIDEIKEMYADVLPSIETMQKDVDSTVERLNKVQEDLSTTRETLKTLEETPTKTSQAEEDLKTADNELVVAQARLEESVNKLIRLNQNLTTLSEIVENKKLELDEAQNRFDQAKESYDIVANDLENAKKELNEANETLKEKTSILENKEKELQKLDDDLILLLGNINKNKETIKTLEEDLPELETKLEKAIEELEKAKEDSRLATEEADKSRALIINAERNVSFLIKYIEELKKEQEMLKAIEDAKKQKEEVEQQSSSPSRLEENHSLPKTGTTANLSMLGGILTTLGFTIFKKRKNK